MATCTSKTCGNSLRDDTKCSDCQNAIRRATKHNNRYRAHGPMQTDSTRTWRQAAREGK